MCIKCGAIKDESEYYLIGGKKPMRICKACVRAARPKKPTGFGKLPQQTQDDIRELLRDRRNKVKDVAEKFAIKIPTLHNWITSGQVLDPKKEGE